SLQNTVTAQPEKSNFTSTQSASASCHSTENTNNSPWYTNKNVWLHAISHSTSFTGNAMLLATVLSAFYLQPCSCLLGCTYPEGFLNKRWPLLYEARLLLLTTLQH